ncbi:MAG: PD40 domain-containing protein [Bryobacterales bacterium]|nr:PD40 domain-containing protein [Bryobacterales bacterium]
MATIEGSKNSSERKPFATDRLDSWKEIADYLRRSERTVRRWEQTLHMPVHRLTGAKRASVFALKSELDDWWLKFEQATEGKAVREDPLPDQRRRRIWLWAGGWITAVFALLLAAQLRPGTREAVRPVWRQVTFDTGSTTEPAISREGKVLVYSSDRAGRGDEDIYVQQLEGGRPARRLTDDRARDCRPDISPDGTRVVFHSYRDGGVIYSIAASGGKEMRLAAGDYPRFSHDGSRIAFDNELPDGSFAIYTVAASGGGVTRVTPPMFRRARIPLWSADGKSILFIGSTHARPQEYDWWAVAADGSNPVATGVSQQLERQGLPRLQFYHSPLDWAGNRVVFAYAGSGNVNLWWIPLSSMSDHTAEPAEQITWGPGMISHVRVAAVQGEKQIAVAAAGLVESQLWQFSIDPGSGTVHEQGRKLTDDMSIVPGLKATRPSLSADGNLLAYASRRTGNYDVWLRDLSTGAERPLAATPRNEVHPIVARDGSTIVFVRLEGDRQSVIFAPAGGSEERQVCSDCGAPADWSPDGSRVLYVSGAERLGLLDLSTGTRSELPSSVPVLSGTFSPDGRTVAIGVRQGETERVYLVPFEGRRWPQQESWIPLTRLPDSAAIWSPQGDIAYFLSVEDEYRCLWAQRIDPAARRTIGDPFAARHFHTMAQYPKMSRWFAIAGNRLVLRLTQERKNIWAANLN